MVNVLVDTYNMWVLRLPYPILRGLDVPGPAEGPITYKDMMGDSLTLMWKPPKDDGGSDITNYIVEKKVAGAPK